VNAQLEAKIEKSKEVLRLARDMSLEYYGKPLVLTYSGGKDSDVMLDLAIKALKPSEFEVINSHTSVDAPETVYHIREVFTRVREGGTECTVHYPRDKDGKQITMWNLIPRKQIPPTRLARYCCAVLKEASTPNRICAVGVRASESSGRKGRDTFAILGRTKAQGLFFSLEHSKEVFEESKDRDPIWDCTLIKNMRENKDIIVNPIYEWTDSEVWEYIHENGVKTNPLYDRGYKRVGCV
jgi:phosphoadenosine phosphosulfate reductase